MNYPLISEYIESINLAKDNFESLSDLRPVLDEKGNPIMTSGNFSVVFKMENSNFWNRKQYAVKCFIKEQEGRREAYQYISELIESEKSPYFIDAKYLERELFVDSKNSSETEYPVLVMDWVEGKNLFDYVRDNIENKYNLEMLYYNLGKLFSYLISKTFAHGDLKTDNIIVKDNGSLVLVDYDGVYTPQMKGQSAREIGSPNFRHPHRTIEEFDEHIDEFSVFLILLALKLIIIDANFFYKYCSNDCFVFTEEDLIDFGESPIFKEIFYHLSDPEISRLYSALVMAYSKKELLPEHIAALNVDISDESKEIRVKELYNKEEYDECFPFLKDLAQKGNGKCQYFLGKFYFLGRVVSQNYALAFEWFSKAASTPEHNKISNALWHLGILYEHGNGVEKNIDKAYELYCKSSDLGDYYALRSKGICLLNGKGVERNHIEAFTCIEESAKSGLSYSAYLLAHLYRDGKGIQQNTEKYIEWLKNAASKDEPHALGEYGALLYDGVIVKQNKREGKSLVQRAVWKNLVSAMVKYAEILEIEKDYCWQKNAIDLLSKAYKKGDSKAAAILGYYYKRGIGFNKSLDNAKKLFEFSYKKGNVRGTYLYALAINEENPQLAKELIIKAAEAGYYYAQMSIAKAYAESEDSELKKEAIKWYTKACEKDKGEAYFRLAECYRQIEGLESPNCKQNLEKAIEKKNVEALLLCKREQDVVTDSIFYKHDKTWLGGDGLYYSDDLNVLCEIDRQNITKRIAIDEGTIVVADEVLSGETFEQIIIPESIRIIGNNPFFKSDIGNVICHSDQFVIKDKMLFDKERKRLIAYWGNFSEISLNDGLETIDNGVFYGHSELQTISLPLSLKKIGDKAFCGSGLKKVELPENVKEIGTHCFRDCEKLESAVIRGSLNKIPFACFAGCGKLGRICFDNLSELNEIGDGSFIGCKKLKLIELPYSIKRIGRDSFRDCKAITEITLPDQLELIEDDAFTGSSIQKISIPENTEIISPEAFNKDTKLTFSGKSKFFSDNNFIYKHDNGITLVLSMNQGENVAIPAFVTEIGCRAFLSNKIKKIHIPSSVKIISDEAFCGCNKLEEVVIESGVTEIDRSAFASCSKITRLVIPESVKSIGPGCFYECHKLKSITINSTEVRITEESFKNYAQHRSKETAYREYKIYKDYGDLPGCITECIDDLREKPKLPTLKIEVKNPNVCCIENLTEIDKHCVKVKVVDA